MVPRTDGQQTDRSLLTHREHAAPQAEHRRVATSMRIQFAPLNIPLRRRLQTAAVVQWVFSFLALGNIHVSVSCLS